MNIIITGHHFELTDKSKAFITDKVQTRLQNFATRLHNVTIVATQEKLNIKAECTVTSDFGEFFASSHDEHLETATEHALTKVLTEIKKKHDKIVDHK